MIAWLQETTGATAGQDGSFLPTTLLPWIAAAGTFISLITLGLTLLFRWWDSRTKLRISCYFFGSGEPLPQSLINEAAHVGPLPQTAEAPMILFRAYNAGKSPVRLRHILIVLDDEQEIELPFSETMQNTTQAYQLTTAEIAPGTPLSFAQDLQLLARDIQARAHGDDIRCKLIIEDTTMRKHKKPLVLRSLGEWSDEGQGQKPMFPRRMTTWLRELLAINAYAS